MTPIDTTFKVYVGTSGIPREWTATEPYTNMSAKGTSRDEALALFERDWNKRAAITLVDGWPPQRRRPDAPQEPIPEDDDGKRLPGYSVYRKLLKRFHPDTNAGKEFTANDVTAALITLWTAARGAKR